VSLGQGLLLRARVRLARGERAGALEDLTALARLADHMLDVPFLTAARLDVYLVGLLRDELRSAWRRGELTSAEVADVTTGSRVRNVLQAALRLDQAYWLDQFGSLALLEPSWSVSATGPEIQLGLIFFFEAEVQALRRWSDELQAKIRDPHVRLEPFIDALCTRELDATLMMPIPEEAATNLDHTLRKLWFCDAEGGLLGAALEVAAAWGDGGDTAQAFLDEHGELLGHAPDVRFQPLENGDLRLTWTSLENLPNSEPPPALVLRGDRLL